MYKVSIRHDTAAEYLCYLLPLTSLHIALNLINTLSSQNENMVLVGILQLHHRLTVSRVLFSFIRIQL